MITPSPNFKTASLNTSLSSTQTKSNLKRTLHHVLTPEGLKPIEEIVTAILDMSQPQDKAATRRFLGTVTYLTKFCPHLSEVVRPLRDLTHADQEFPWADQHTKHSLKLRNLSLKSSLPSLF